MNSKRTYLDSLNAGRQRRPYASLDDLNRSLENLERRLDRNNEMQDDRRFHRDEVAPPARPQVPASRTTADQPYQSLARDLDRVRGQEEGAAAVGKIAGELKGLREELRHQMTAGLQREFDALRKDIARVYSSPSQKVESAELGVEFERLSDAIHSLAEKSDDKSVNLLRLELEQVKGSLDTLAREETVRSVGRRWDDFDRRWSDFEGRVSGGALGNAEDPGLAALHARLEQINDAVNNLPESLSLRSLEEKVRMLAGAVDHFARREDRRGPDAIVHIDERLDEISRAIVASAASAQAPSFDPQPFERIEARITSLARQLEELVEDRPNVEVIDRLNSLSQRVDDLAAHANVPEKAVERLAMQVAAIAAKLDNAPSAAPVSDQIFEGIEQRFDMLSALLDRRQGDAIEHSQALFRDLERRLDDVADRLDQRTAIAAFDNTGIMDAIDARFSDFARKLEGQGTGGSDEAIRSLEARLEDISGRLGTSASQVGGIDPELIRNLEAQIAGLTTHLARPGSPMPEFEDIGPRLDDIEKSIAGSRDTILETARKAAEDAVRSFAGSKTDALAVAGLAEDLKSLESLTRRSDERNSKTFEAIHDTLLKIVDRLGSLEATPPGPIPSRKLELQNTPSIETDDRNAIDAESPEPEMDVTPAGWGDVQAKRSPAEAAAAAAVAALSTDASEEAEAGGRVRTMLGGLSRAFGGRKESEPVALAGSPAPSMEATAQKLDLDEPLDPALANQPLEPGSGAPDLSAIMKRVRDERGQPARQGEPDAAKSDFIAAARRAAQAAAAEAEILKRKADNTGPKRGLKIGELLRAKRKPILMAATAIMIALAGLQLGKAFFASDREIAQSDVPATTAEQKPGDTAAIAPDAPAGDDAAAGDNPAVRMVDAPDEIPAADSPAEATPGMEAAPPAAAPTVEAMAPAAEEGAEPGPDTALTASTSQTPASEATPVEPVPLDAGPLPLREAADAGDAKAIFEVGSRYADGRGVKADMAAAAKWYEKSAELGFAPAEYRIGNFYEKGIGVTRDVAKAKTWYQLAAAQGNASAMHNLAVLFAMGTDDVTDNESAARWFIQAAELGVKDSQFNLGILAAKGVGTPQNLEESYKWFALVAKTGDRDAAAKRDEIANALRPEQLERARAATELWKPKPVNAETNSVEIPESWQESDATTASVDMKKAVQNIQRILNKNGYDAGGSDGIMGQKTKTAIAAFQKDNGMEVTGEVNETLVRALLEKK